mmetsp:Transcript_25135/g.72684  ORF Transcript_25135/g.72684 Transcript_25135/m.72684 type:complete len:286 (+) Transcript_25135:1935-2792(+)
MMRSPPTPDDDVDNAARLAAARLFFILRTLAPPALAVAVTAAAAADDAAAASPLGLTGGPLSVEAAARYSPHSSNVLACSSRSLPDDDGDDDVDDNISCPDPAELVPGCGGGRPTTCSAAHLAANLSPLRPSWAVAPRRAVRVSSTFQTRLSCWAPPPVAAAAALDLPPTPTPTPTPPFPSARIFPSAPSPSPSAVAPPAMASRSDNDGGRGELASGGCCCGCCACWSGLDTAEPGAPTDDMLTLESRDMPDSSSISPPLAVAVAGENMVPINYAPVRCGSAQVW